MTQVVYRYPIELNESGQFKLELPLGSRLLHVAPQERAPHEPSLWALVDLDRAKKGDTVIRNFRVVGTGHEHEELWPELYVASWQLHGFVWHLFEEP